MNSNINVRLEKLQYIFTSVVQASVSLAANDKGTTCNIRLADVSREIGNALIAHSLASGGIRPLPEEPAVIATNAPALNVEADSVPLDPGKQNSYTQNWSSIELLLVRECLRQGLTLPDQIVYVLATAAGETGKGRDLIEVWDGRGAQATYDGRLGNSVPGDGYRYRGRGLSQVTGKERYAYWSKQMGIDFVDNPDAMAKLSTAIPVLVRGMRDGGFTGRKLETYINAAKTDFYNARRVINGIIPKQQPIYMNLAAYYKARIADLTIAAQAQPLASSATKPVDTTVKTAPVTPVTTEPIIKGNKLFVDWLDVSFEFYHTGTDVNSDGTTTLTGQGLRWVLNRRKRTKAVSGLTFSQLAARIGKSHGITVEYQAAFDPSFEVVEQAGISDYALLKREAGRAGLYISESPGKVVIQSLSQIKDTTILLEVGVNLLKYTVKDRAIDADATVEQPDSSLTAEVKGVIDPLTGKLVQKIPDVDPAKKTKDTTGTTPTKAPISGVMTPGQEIKATQQLQRVKRVKGLPSTFTVATNSTFMTLTPLSALRTKGISKYLDRVWLVDKVTHSSDGTTTIDCFSPVEVVDLSPTIQNVVNPTGVVTDAPPGVFICPTTGKVTSVVGNRSAPKAGASTNHKGTDIANAIGTPIVASEDGIVSFSGVQRGYGNVVYIKHANGYETRYAHLSQIQARLNATIKKGQAVGLMGTTGNVTGCHLHFEIRKDDGNTVLSSSEYGIPSLSVLGGQVTVGSTQ